MKSKNVIKVISLIILLIIIYFYVDLTKIIYYLKQTKIEILLLFIPLIFPLYLFKAIRLNRLLACQGINYSIKDTLFIFFSSNFLGFITPGRIGEFAKIVYLKQDLDIPFSKSFPAVIVDRFYDLYFLTLVAIFGLLYFNILDSFPVLIYASIIFLLIVPFILFNQKVLEYFYELKVIRRFKKIREFLKIYTKEVNGMISLKKILMSMIYTTISYAILFTQCKLILMSLDININYIQISYMMAITNLVTFLPVSISGIGTRDITLMFLFSLVGIQKELAISYSFIVLIMFNLIGGFICFIFWYIKPIDIKLINKNKKL